MTVLIVAPETDEHGLAVAAEIARQGGQPQTLDLESFPEHVALSMRYDCCGGRRDFTMARRSGSLAFADVGSVWWRRPQPARIASAITRSSHRQFAANEAQEALAGLWYALDASWINEPARDETAARKAYQLKIAQEIGFAIPATLMTNDPDAVRLFVDARGYRNVVYKSFSSTHEEWRETRLLKTEELALIDNVRYSPVIFQEYVEADVDLRITVVDDSIFPAAIHSQQTAYKVDCRIDIGNALIESTTLPADLEEKIMSLMRRLGLVYGAIDMRLTPDGRYVFLEINPAGQWLYIEQATRQPISSRLAKALVEADRH